MNRKTVMAVPMACFGACPAEGASPVQIPALDDQYMPAR